MTAVANDNVNKISSIDIEYDDLIGLQKKLYGIGDSELVDIKKFSDSFCELLDKLKNISDKKTILKQIIDLGNKIPSYSGLSIMELCLNRKADLFYSMILDAFKMYTETLAKDAKSSFASDLYETISCFFLFMPQKNLRTFLFANSVTFVDFFKKMLNRPSSMARILSTFAEFYLTSKGDKKYAQSIVLYFQILIDKIKETNGVVKEIQDTVLIDFIDIKKLIKDFHQQGTRKESLKNVNIILNRKIDLGELFHCFIFLNPSVAANVISSEFFSNDMIKFIFPQLRVHQLIECGILLSYAGLDSNKMNIFAEEIKTKYEIEFNDKKYLNKLSTLVQKKLYYEHGILLRDIDLMPTVHVDTITDGVLKLLPKLMTVANNLSAGISNKSLSITVGPMSKSNLGTEIVKSVTLNEKSINKSSHVAKIDSKNVLKSIKEGNVGILTLDQFSGRFSIILFESLVESFNANKTDINSAIQNAYVLMVKKYGFIVKKDYFLKFTNFIISKIYVEKNVDTQEEFDHPAPSAVDSGDTVIDEE